MSSSKALDLWTAEKIRQERPLMREQLDAYTVRKLLETLEYAISHSSFYMEKLGRAFPFGGMGNPGHALSKGFGDPTGLKGFLEKFQRLPFTYPEELRQRGAEFLCVSPGEISRIVTLDTSGSTGQPKRIYFTEEDQQLTVDYFQHGMQLIVGKEDKVLILMPAKIPGSIGKLLEQGLQNFGASAMAYGLPGMMSPEDEEAGKLLKLMESESITSVVAMPTHMRMLAEAELIRRQRSFSPDVGSANPAVGKDLPASAALSINLRTVLLSAEYVPDEDVRRIEQVFGCRVHQHYGMTEMGLGCAVSCGHGEGYHVRESDLYMEIIDPDTGRVVEDGQPGEIVFTTLTRKGMPFIRYRTGDRSRWITEDCPCGSVLKRLDKVGMRRETKGLLSPSDREKA
ncbi:MAG: AMP-binding protein [Bacillota bacterium]|nr:AMP-binding protein [Bacillota bacterium]